MKKFILKKCNHDGHYYYSEIDGSFEAYLEVEAGVFFLTLCECSSDDEFNIEIPVEYDDVTSHIISLEETDFYDIVFPKAEECMDKHILKFLKSDNDILDCNEFANKLGKIISKVASEVAKEHESYKGDVRHVENISHGYVEDPETL